ncbi:MAG: S-layer homology domain-containing protein [Actinomycetota bacterium]|nr:S-layer homology domain-containing protein [Actinomycetota bacterium]
MVGIAAVLMLFGVLAAPVAVSASHQFVDVPDANIFHNDIDWLATNGVTQGCNPPTNDMFCPSDNVTREQMAAFMKRLATSKIVDAATAVTASTADMAADSDLLDGLDSPNYVNVLASSAGSFIDSTAVNLTAGQTVTATSVNITVPGPGVLLVNNTSSWDVSFTDYVIHSWAELDTTPSCDPNYFAGAPLTGSFATDAEDASAGRANTAGVSSVEVPAAGTYTVHHCLQSFAGGATGLDHALSVQWYPAAFASVANPPSPVGESPSRDVEGATSSR